MDSSWLNTKRIWQLVALTLGISAAIAVYTWAIFTTTPELGDQALRQTAYEVAGPTVIYVVAAPLALLAIPLLLRGRAWVVGSFISGVALILYSVTGIMSIGLLFLPATIASVVGAFVQPPVANE